MTDNHAPVESGGWTERGKQWLAEGCPPIQPTGADPVTLTPEQIVQEPDMEMFGRRIKESRKARGMSLDALATASGMSKPHIWELERGTSKNPSIRAVWSIAGGLAVTPAYLLGLQTDVSPIDPLALEVAALIERRLRVRAICHCVGTEGEANV